MNRSGPAGWHRPGKRHVSRLSWPKRASWPTVVFLAVTVVAVTSAQAAKRVSTKSSEAQLVFDPPVGANGVVDIATLTKTTTLTKAGRRVDQRKGRAKSITLTGPRGLERSLVVDARAAAERFGTANTVVDQATLELVGVERGARLIQITKFPFSFPVSTISLGPIAARSLYGPVTADAVERDVAVLGKTSARLRKAAVGDILVFRHWDRPKTLIRILVGAIVPDEDAGNAEVLISRRNAASLGFSRPSRIVAWGNIDRVSKVWEGLVPESYLRRSATPPTIDSVLNQAELKTVYGEFIVRRDRGRIESDPDWVKGNLVDHEYPVIGRVRCHQAMVEPLDAVMREIVASGLQSLVNVNDTKRAGGCFSAREIRTPTGSSGRNLSRHAWAAAIDINPSANRFGAKPTMDARLVYVFRRHGFAWGGTWSIPDGMHFELIGAPRISGAPLPSSTTTTSTTTITTTTEAPSSTTAILDAPALPAVSSSTSTIAVTTTRLGAPTSKGSRTTTSRPSSVSGSTTSIPAGSTTSTTTVTPPASSEPPVQEPSAGDVPA
jgi:hypothetical protein